MDSIKQDQTARTCSLILLYTVRKMDPWSQTAGQRGSIQSTHQWQIKTLYVIN